MQIIAKYPFDFYYTLVHTAHMLTSKEKPTIFCSHLDESMELLREAVDALVVKTPSVQAKHSSTAAILNGAFGVFATALSIVAERVEVPDEEALQNTGAFSCVSILVPFPAKYI